MEWPSNSRAMKFRRVGACVAVLMTSALLPMFGREAFGQVTRVTPQYQQNQNPNQNGQPGQPTQAGQNQPGQTPPTQQPPNAQLPAPIAPRGGDLVLGPGDVLQIQVADDQDLNGKYLVSDSGEITVPTVPDPIHVTGLNTTQLAAAIGKGLKDAKILQHPAVSVFVEEYHSHTVTVVGAVVRPGLYPIEKHTTVLEVISEAGGLLPTAGNFVTVAKGGSPTAASLETDAKQEGATQAGAKNSVAGAAANNGATVQKVSLPKTTPPPANRDTVNLDFSKLITGKDPSVNIEVKAGDVVSVGTAPVIYIVGAVTRPGAFAVQNDRSQITVLQALALVEGMTPVASAGHAVIVRNSTDEKQRQEIPIDINKVTKGKNTDQYLVANDILFIPESGRKKTMKHLGDAAVTAASQVAGYGLGLRVAAF